MGRGGAKLELKAPQTSSWLTLGLPILDISFGGGKISHSPIKLSLGRGTILQDFNQSCGGGSQTGLFIRNSWWAREKIFLSHPENFWLNRSMVGLEMGISNSFQGTLVLPEQSWRITVRQDKHGLPDLFLSMTWYGRGQTHPSLCRPFWVPMFSWQQVMATLLLSPC